MEKHGCKIHGIRLRLHVLCFLFSIWGEVLYGDIKTTAGLLYFHTIISHYSNWYEKQDFKNGSTEFGEQFFEFAIITEFGLGTLNNTRQAGQFLQSTFRLAEQSKDIQGAFGEIANFERIDKFVYL